MRLKFQFKRGEHDVSTSQATDPATIDTVGGQTFRPDAPSSGAGVVPSSSLVIFGITGDLSRKKLLPAIYDLANRGLLPPTFSLVGFGRHEPDRVIETIQAAMIAGARTSFRIDTWNQLARNFRYIRGTFDDQSAFEDLKRVLAQLDTIHSAIGHAFYMSISPAHFSLVCAQLNSVGLNQDRHGYRRIVLEKPFGNDLASSRELGATVDEVFGAGSVFRVDHYLGKETVQNILALRFANGLFEPLWNHRHIDNIQITMAEDIGVEGRAGYYDGVGAARDVIQNHLLQLLALIAMEEPVGVDAASLSAEKVKVLSATSAVSPLADTTARGQYSATVRGETYLPGLLEEDGFDPCSTTETYAAITVQIANRRWAGVPFYLRAGKRLARRTTEVAVTFSSPHHLTGSAEAGPPPQNVLVVRVQPDDGISLRIGAKTPGEGMRIQDVDLNMSFADSFGGSSPEAYERLILDVLRGDASLFPSQAEVDASWAIVDPVIAFWAEQGRPDTYQSGSAGPSSAIPVVTRTGRAWRPL
ncbi:Glucose-6-phosphate 1-dehydrogenase (plasmid) [Rhodococcus opacus]|uniref:Glucose-6-phosphate 1-dehydrogenase n=2 Tax=Rhodococcus opacus TaxID=37919 RepID=A0A1B1KIT9_RHOOP|nr:Glucose-6-phosphate 1-dehydrogenase [Rhodococcus opacus]